MVALYCLLIFMCVYFSEWNVSYHKNRRFSRITFRQIIASFIATYFLAQKRTELRQVKGVYCYHLVLELTTSAYLVQEFAYFWAES